MSDVRTKINSIRDTLGNLTNEQSSAIEAWEKSLKKHELYAAWCKHPITKEVFKKLQADLTALNMRLSTERDLSQTTREAIFEVKDAYLWLLSLPHSNQSALKNIERDINDAMTEVEDNEGEFNWGKK